MKAGEQPDDSNFLALVDQNRGRIWKICRAYARSPADQEDLYQEILYQIWQALPGLKQARHASTWMYRVSLNTAISFLRQQMSRSRLKSELKPELFEEISQSRPVEIAASSDEMEMLYEAIDRLDPKDKAVVTLYLEDLSHEEIAEVLGVTSNHAGVMIHRVKKKLSDLVQKEPGSCNPPASP